MNRQRKPGLLIAACLLTAMAQAQTVGVRNVRIAPRDATTAAVTFDIAWDGAWRTDTSHDAVWVFFKIRPQGETAWRHARLVARKVVNPDGYSAGAGSAVELVVPDGKDGYTGLFVRRTVPHVPAPLAVSNVTALVEWPTPITGNRPPITDIRAFGILMVYVPAGPFYLGSGGSEVKSFYQYTDGTQNTRPYRVTGPGEIAVGKKDGLLWARDRGLEDGLDKIPASFPNGYAAFYCMKHIVWEPVYAEFLKMLDETQAAKLSRSASIRGPFWADIAGYAAWAGLRPMTELEWVKAMRGPRVPLPDEVGPSYWGLSVDSSWWNRLLHDTAVEARVITAGNAAGRRFKGTHGDGSINLPADWPGEDAVGTGLMTYGLGQAGATRLSDRRHVTDTSAPPSAALRFRAVRTAPGE